MDKTNILGRIWGGVGIIFGKLFTESLTVISIALTTFGTIIVGKYDFSQNPKLLDDWRFILTYPFVLFTIAAGFSLLHIIINLCRSNKLNKLEKSLTLSEQKNKDLEKSLNDTQLALNNARIENSILSERSIEAWLKFCYKSHGFGSTERISVYYEADEHLYLLTRYSSRTDYNQKHRVKFPIGNDILSQCWRIGMIEVTNLPNYKNNKIAYYKRVQEDYGYDEDLVKNLTMKSRYYLAHAIKDADINIGVMILESTKQEFLTEDKKAVLINQIVDNSSSLAQYIRHHKDSNYRHITPSLISDTMALEASLLPQKQSQED